MSEQRVNVPLLRKAVEWAEAEAAKPELECRWDQSGWVTDPDERAWAIAAGRVEYDGRPYREVRHERELLAAELAPQCGTCYCIAGFVAVEVVGKRGDFFGHEADIATEALGLDPADAGALFFGQNTIADVRRVAEDIAGERL